MAKVKFIKGTEEWQLFVDYWQLCQEYWEPEDDDKYWEELINAADSFRRKYNTSFARALASELVSEAERKKNGLYDKGTTDCMAAAGNVKRADSGNGR